jgi:hypothetical protein
MDTALYRQGGSFSPVFQVFVPPRTPPVQETYKSYFLSLLFSSFKDVLIFGQQGQLFCNRLASAVLIAFISRKNDDSKPFVAVSRDHSVRIEDFRYAQAENRTVVKVWIHEITGNRCLVLSD